MESSSAFLLFTDIAKQYFLSSLLKNLMIGRCSVRAKFLKQDSRWFITVHCMYLNHFPKATSLGETACYSRRMFALFTVGHITCGQVESSWSVLLFCTSEARYLPSPPALTPTDVISTKHTKLRYKILTMKQLCCIQLHLIQMLRKANLLTQSPFHCIVRTPDLYHKAFYLYDLSFGKF